MNLGVYPESDPESIAYPSLFTVKCPFRMLDIIRLQKSTMKSSCGGGARGAYLAHGLFGSHLKDLQVSHVGDTSEDKCYIFFQH